MTDGAVRRDEIRERKYLSQGGSSLIGNINLNRKKKISWGNRALELRMAPVL
jgi:hypothetical protein